ncbi:hypothetical protein WJX81_002159 [Elliptochloris bilobata]|uniref:CBS domain-containing protein n=1 Tax=Elliptochloris bilobata TaxID=381761 RepID=A0AAW1S2I3_9CHLO
MAFFVPTRFTWRFGGQMVHLCGSFTRWVETVPMAAVDGSPGVYSVVVHLPPGYHQYKFIVDGEWRHDETQPFMPDPLGNVNNWLFVRRPEAQAQQSGALHGTHAAPHQPLAHTSPPLAPLAPAAAPAHHPQPAAAAAQPPASSMAATGSISTDVDMQSVESSADSVLAPIALQADEPAYTRNRVRDFLRGHSCYELIPESGKVVLLDTGLPIRQAFHALHEQGVASAPLWDADTVSVVGMISASDFIFILRRLRSSVTSGGNPMSEAEMDNYTIRGLREEATAAGRPPKPLVSLRPQDSLHAVIGKLFRSRCSMAPVLSSSEGGEACTLLHIATISGALACLMRHFRASLASLPLLAQPISALPVGTWSPNSLHAQAEPAANGTPQGSERRDWRKVRPLHTVQPGTPLTTALGLLLEAGVSVLPVVDESGVLLDMYARSDITQLARGNAYNRLQWEEVTVGQALALAQLSAPAWPGQPGAQGGEGGGVAATKLQRVYVCTARDTLRSVVERLSVPGVRRLFIMDPATRRVEGLVSLSDVAAFLFDVI